MNILEVIFIAISKLYIKRSGKNEDWFYLSLLIISFIIGLDIYVITLIYFDLYFVYPLVFVFVLFFALVVIFGKFKTNKELIIKYKFKRHDYIAILLLPFIQFLILFYLLPYALEIKGI